MAEAPERLFRDDAGAAIERAARLEQENQELRNELRRFQRQGEVPTIRTRREPPRFMAAAVMVGGGLLMAMTMVGVANRAAYRPPPPAFAQFPAPPVHPLPPGLIGASPARQAPVVIADPAADEANDCETPYTYDEQNVKHYKMQCIHPERVQR